MDPKKETNLTTAFDAQRPQGNDNATAQKTDPYLGMMGYPYNVQVTSQQKKP